MVTIAMTRCFHESLLTNIAFTGCFDEFLLGKPRIKKILKKTNPDIIYMYIMAVLYWFLQRFFAISKKRKHTCRVKSQSRANKYYIRLTPNRDESWKYFRKALLKVQSPIHVVSIRETSMILVASIPSFWHKLISLNTSKNM